MSEEVPIQSPIPETESFKQSQELEGEPKSGSQVTSGVDPQEPSEESPSLETAVSIDEKKSNESADQDVASNNDSFKTLDNNARLEQLENEHETLKSQYMRIAADFDNFRKRQSRDNDDLKLQLTCTTLSEILPVVDNFERARQQLDPKGEEAQALHRNYQGLYKQLVDVLKQLGVAPMRVVGQSFDPNLHEAVLREPSNEQQEDIILEELQRGYHLNGKVLRHALVKVSMGPGKSPAPDSNSSQETTELDPKDSSSDSNQSSIDTNG